MKSIVALGKRPSLWVVPIVLPLLIFAIACAADEPTATPTATLVPQGNPTVTPTATLVPQGNPTATPTATATGIPTSTPADTIKRGGQIVQMGAAYPTHFDLHQQCCQAINILQPVYTTVMYDAGPSNAKVLECGYCDKWSLEDGGMTMVFQIRKDFAFHDGTPVTSRDIKYSISKVSGYVDGIVNVRYGWLRNFIDTVETPDDSTLKIRLVRPAPVLPSLLAGGFIVIYPDGTTKEEVTQVPLGPNNKYTSGPFYIKEAVKDSHLILERHPNYYKKGTDGKSLPYLDSIKVQNFADPWGAAVTALITGRVDMWIMYNRPPTQFYGELNKIIADGTITQIRKPSYSQTAGVWMNFQNPVTKDIRVREAINLSIDRVQYGEAYHTGQYLASSYFGSDTPWGRPESEIWDVLPGWGRGAKKQAEWDQSKKILADAGFTALDMPIMVASRDWGGEGFQRDLINGGFTSNLDTESAFTDFARRQTAGEYTLFTYPATLAIGVPDELYGNYFLTGSGRNWRGYSNSEFDNLYPLMSGESDPIKQKQLVRQMEDILRADIAQAVMTDGYQDYFYITGLRNYTPGRYYFSSNFFAEDWWLEQ